MKNYMLALMLILGWAIGVANNVGAGIHLLLFVAMMTVAGSQNKQRRMPRHDSGEMVETNSAK